MFPSTYISCDYCCVTFVSLFNLRHPRDFHVAHIPKGNLVLHVLMCFFCTSAFFLLAVGFFSHSRLRGTQGVHPNTTTQVWALTDVSGTCSGGSKSRNWQITTGRHFEHVEPSRPMQTHIQIKKISDGLRLSFRILLAVSASTDCLPTSCSCSSAHARARVHLVLIECSCSCSSARARVHLVLVLDCCRARVRARVLIFQRVGMGKYMYSKHIFILLYIYM